MLNKSKGNMYPHITHTWNTVKGKCPHGCAYCYMKKWGEQPELHFDEKELKTDLGAGNFIFVGSSCDIWAEEIPESWILKTLELCKTYCNNRYLFQTKNPQRMSSLVYRGKIGNHAGHAVEYCTTIETNRDYPQMGNAPLPRQRSAAMMEMDGFNRTVTIEPIFDMDIEYFVPLIQRCRPWSVNIGADSGGHTLPEPRAEKVFELVTELRKFTEVKIKKNLKRIMGRLWDQLPK